ncbi:MAG: hypothetical protein RIR62_3273 [Pseudomonadota bacterium]|jgi:hypothetical protein
MHDASAQPLYDRLAQAAAPWLPGIYLLLLWQSGWLDLLFPVSVVVLQVLGLLLLWELVALATADPLTRALMWFRWRSRGGANPRTDTMHLVKAIDMLRPAPASRGEAAMAYGKLTEAAVRLNMRHPNPLAGPVTAKRLTRAIEDLPPALPAGQAVTPPPVPLSAIWPQPRSDFSLGGVVLEFRRSIGKLFLRRQHHVAKLCIAGERALSRKQDRAKRPVPRWQAPDFPQHEIWRRASTLSVASGLPMWNAEPALLPLSRQRRLAAAVLLLSAAPGAVWRSRLLVPFDTAYLAEIRHDIAQWQAIHGPLPRIQPEDLPDAPAYAVGSPSPP